MLRVIRAFDRTTNRPIEPHAIASSLKATRLSQSSRVRRWQWNTAAIPRSGEPDRRNCTAETFRQNGTSLKDILIAVIASHIRLVASGRMFTVPRHELGSNDEGVLQGIPTDDQGRGQFSYLHLPGDSISRIWTDDRGRQFVGELVARWGNNLMLQKRDRVYLVSTAQLSNNDRLVVLHALRSETRLANLVR
jgi:hypothetical protein